MANRYYDPKKVNSQPRFDANAAYNLSSFEVERPLREERPAYEKPDLKVAGQRQPRTKAELRSEELRSYKVSVKVVAVAVILFAMLAAVLYGESTKNQLTREIAQIQKEMNVAESENTRLNMQLNALVSVDQIEQYATEKLGMVKMSKNQIEYVNTADTQQGEGSGEKDENTRVDPGAGEVEQPEADAPQE